MTREELNKQKQKEVTKSLNNNTRKKICLIILKLLIIIIILLISLYLINKYITTSKIIVKEERLINIKIPDSFNGTKIIQFSDLHYGTTVFIDELKKLVNIINERNPDLIFFTGDLIDKDYKLTSKEQEEIIKELSKIKASIGKYAISGEEDKESFTTILNQSNFTILNNDYELIYNNSNQPILLIGISSKLSGKSDVEKAYNYFNTENHNSNIYTITLLHEPDIVTEITTSTDLFLAGHSHNNSVNFPWGTSPYKIDGALTYNKEYYEIDNSKLYISSGIGTNGNRIRFLAQPSINFLRLSNK